MMMLMLHEALLVEQVEVEVVLLEQQLQSWMGTNLSDHYIHLPTSLLE